MRSTSNTPAPVQAFCCTLVLALAGCGEKAALSPMDPSSGATAGAGGADVSGTDATAGAAVTSVGGDASTGMDASRTTSACDVPMGARVWLDAPDAVMAALPGHWVRCGHALTSDEAEVGLEITADYRFSILVKGPDGTAVPSTSLLETGHVMVEPLGTFDGHLSFNLNFATDANLTYETRPFFTNGTPLELVTTNTDIFWLRYVRLR